MNRDFIKKYVESIPVYFKDKKQANLRIFKICDGLFKFLKCSKTLKKKVFYK